MKAKKQALLSETLKVFENYDGTQTVEASKDGETWEWLPEIDWDSFNYYRFSPIVKPSINWDQVSEEFNYLAVDPDARPWLFTTEPDIRYNAWVNNSGEEGYADALGFKSYVRGNVDWKQSLIWRP